jgi:hypothetical protein
VSPALQAVHVRSLGGSAWASLPFHKKRPEAKALGPVPINRTRLGSDCQKIGYRPVSTLGGSWDCGGVDGLIATDLGAYSENDRAGPLDRKPRMPQMRKDRNRQAFSSKRASIP